MYVWKPNDNLPHVGPTLFFVTRPAIELELIQWAKLVGQQAIGISLSPPLSVEEIGTNKHILDFLFMVLNIGSGRSLCVCKFTSQIELAPQPT